MNVADTSVLIDLLRGKISAEKLENFDTLSTCYPIQCELFKGTRIARNTEEGEKQVEKQVEKLLQRLNTLKSGEKEAKKFAELKETYPEISEFDLMIASICISHNAALLTQDSDFEKIEGLECKSI